MKLLSASEMLLPSEAGQTAKQYDSCTTLLLGLARGLFILIELIFRNIF